MTSFRKQRVADLLLGFLAEQIRRFNDPRLQFVTLTGVDVSPDLKLARVFWALPPQPTPEGATSKDSEEPASLTASEGRVKAADEALVHAEPLLKKQIADELDLRYVPKLVFRYDNSSAVGSRIDYLLKKAGF